MKLITYFMWIIFGNFPADQSGFIVYGFDLFRQGYVEDTAEKFNGSS